MSFKHSLDQGTYFGFIPHRLAVKGRPELDVFPFNVLFMKYLMEKMGKRTTGTALYEPDLASFLACGDKRSLEYHNVYGGKNWLLIEYDMARNAYEGTKFVNGENVGMATGMDWKMFFVHFTALGLFNGEQCKFQDAGSND